MGGNAIKSAKRLSVEKVKAYTQEIYDIFPEFKMEMAKAYRTKSDFGDIDIIVESKLDWNIKDLIKNRINPIEFYDNGPYYSFLFHDAQIDFIIAPPDEYDSTLSYMSWNDLSNFFGRVARSLNFKYGHDGLSYEKHLDDHYKITIPVSNWMPDILTFLGYDYNTWAKGFDTIEDILKYAASSKYFNPLYFTLEDQSHNDRVRNKKRKMYQNMLQYITDNNIPVRDKLTESERLDFVVKADSFFSLVDDSTLSDKLLAAETKYAEHLKFKELFNGDIVNKLSEAEGKMLGVLIRDIHTKYPNLKELVLLGGESLVKDIVNGMIDGPYHKYIKAG